MSRFCPPEIVNGYAAKTTAEKLGIGPGGRVAVRNARGNVRLVIAEYDAHARVGVWADL